MKQLEWKFLATPPSGEEYASTSIGTYFIKLDYKRFPVKLHSYQIGTYGTLEAAKAVAQADHNARIRSCLLDKPEAGEVEQLRAENAKLKKIIASCQWHWPADDTSSEMCSDGPWEIAENCDVRPGEVFAYSRGGVVETRWYGFLPAADDADSDDEFTVDEATEDTAAAKMNAEIARRAALTQEPTNE